MKSLRKTLISLSLVGAMLASSPLGTVKAAADSEGKYISEVYVAYGANEEEARNWLTANGWEPVGGDLGAGKASVYDTDSAAVLGIHRTGNAADAITDMAVMNMKGAYSFDMYTEIVNEKKTEINAFLDSFTPVLNEYRDNYNGNGSEAGKVRAAIVHDMLNKFYDGKDDEYAVNDTGKPLGDLLLNQTKHEIGDDAYNELSEEEKLDCGDLQQILLESTPQAVLIVEQMLALASDTGEESWLERLTAMQGDGLSDEIVNYVEGATSGMSESAAENLLAEKYEDTAVALSQQWNDIHNELVWYEEYTEGNGLVQSDSETDEEHEERVNKFFDTLYEENEGTAQRYSNDSVLHTLVYCTPYEGEWGETLGDFFMPEDGTSYDGDYVEFLRFAAALSEGQRAGMDFLSLYSLLMVGTNNKESVEEVLPDMKDLLKDLDKVSIYSGMKRAIFRDGVALTSEALAEKAKDRDPYDNLLDITRWQNIVAYSTFALGISTFIAGAAVKIYRIKAYDIVEYPPKKIASYNSDVKALGIMKKNRGLIIDDGEGKVFQITDDGIKNLKDSIKNNPMGKPVRLSKIAGTLMVVGGVLMLAAGVYKGYDYLNSYYHCDFTKIPLLIVDEEDIVTYRTDENGNQILDENGKPIRDINFDQFAYYDAVKCNRQIIGVSSDAQNGVDSYAEWGCGDVADLNCDYGKEWLALYTNKSSAKGNPILADSLTVQYGSNALPKNCTKSLHTFRNTYAFNVANANYSYNDNMNGIYLFWNDDPNAYGTASAAGSVFNSGLAALLGVGGLGLGVLGTMLVMMPKRKKEETNSVSIG